jgi:hypothetical protein
VRRWKLNAKPRPWRAWVRTSRQAAVPPTVASDTLAVTFINHATFLLRTHGCSLLTDPIWPDRASPFRLIGHAGVRDPGIGFEDLPHVDAVLLCRSISTSAFSVLEPGDTLLLDRRGNRIPAGDEVTDAV